MTELYRKAAAEFRVEKENLYRILQLLNMESKPDTDSIMQAEALNKTVECAELISGDDGTIIGIQFEMIARSGKGFFDLIAPYVAEDSYIELRRRDGTYLRWIFKHQKCHEIGCRMLWEDVPPADVPDDAPLFAGVILDTDKLLTMQDILDELEDDPTDRQLGHIREKYDSSFGKDIIWRYPISDGYHMGTCIIPVKEGFMSLPYDEAVKEDYEIYIPEDASLFKEPEDFDFFIDDYESYSRALLNILSDARRIWYNKKYRGESL